MTEPGILPSPIIWWLYGGKLNTVYIHIIYICINISIPDLVGHPLLTVSVRTS